MGIEFPIKPFPIKTLVRRLVEFEKINRPFAYTLHGNTALSQATADYKTVRNPAIVDAKNFIS